MSSYDRHIGARILERSIDRRVYIYGTVYSLAEYIYHRSHIAGVLPVSKCHKNKPYSLISFPTVCTAYYADD